MHWQPFFRLLSRFGPRGPTRWFRLLLGFAGLVVLTLAVLGACWSVSVFLLAHGKTIPGQPPSAAGERPPLEPLLRSLPSGSGPAVLLERLQQRWTGLHQLELAWLALLGHWALLVLLWLLWWWGMQRAAWNQAQQFASRLRQQIYLQAFQLGEPLLFGTHGGHRPLARLFDQSVEACRQGAALCWGSAPQHALLLLVFFTVALWIHPWITLAVLALAALLFVLGSGFQDRSMHQQALLRDRMQRQMLGLQETLGLSRLVNTLLLDETPGTPFAESLEHLDQFQRSLQRMQLARRLRFRLGLLAGFTLALALVGFNAFGHPQGITLPQVLLLVGVLVAGYATVRRALRHRSTLISAAREAQQITEFLEQPPCVAQVPHAQEVPPLKEAIVFDDVVLQDALGRRLLDRFTLSVPQGAFFALVGNDRRELLAAGSLLARLCDPTAGRVLWDQLDLAQASLDTLRRRLGLLFQQDLLFTGTVMENVLCGDPRYAEDDVRRLARSLSLSTWIDRLPQGWDTVVGQLGNWVHPLEAHFIGLLRILLREPEVLFIEEPWEEADQPLEQLWEETLERIRQNRTVIVVAHRLSTLRGAEQVCLLDSGRVVAQSPHAQLVQASHLYRHLLYIWFNQFREKDQVASSTA